MNFNFGGEDALSFFVSILGLLEGGNEFLFRSYSSSVMRVSILGLLEGGNEYGGTLEVDATYGRFQSLVYWRGEMNLRAAIWCPI